MDGLLGSIEETWHTLLGDGHAHGGHAHGPESVRPPPRAAPPRHAASWPKKFEKNDKDDTIIHYRGTTPQHKGRGGKGEKGDPTWLLGINVLVVDGLVSVKSFIPNSICEDQLEPGDIIHSIDDQACTSVESLRNACPGTAGSLLRVSYSRPPDAQPLDLVLERAVLPCGTGYFRKISNKPSPVPATPVDTVLKARADAARDLGRAPREIAAVNSSVEATLASLDKSTRTSSPQPYRAASTPPCTPQQPPSSSKVVRQSKDGRDLQEMRDLAEEVPELREAMIRERERVMEERIEFLVALADQIDSALADQIDSALMRVQGLREQKNMLLQENVSLRHRLQVQAHAAASAKSVGGSSYEALARRNRALENEVRALTEDLDEHYVPVTVFEAVVREREAAHRELERMRQICSRSASTSSSPRLAARDAAKSEDVSPRIREARQTTRASHGCAMPENDFSLLTPASEPGRAADPEMATSETATCRGYVGMEVTKRPPFVVLAIDDLMDENGVLQGQPAYANESVRTGDKLLRVDGTNVEATTVKHLHDLLSGSMHSLVDLAFLRASGGQYHVRVKRHGLHEHEFRKRSPPRVSMSPVPATGAAAQNEVVEIDVSTEASKESKVHGGEMTQKISRRDEVTSESDGRRVGDTMTSEDRGRLQRERDELEKVSLSLC